MELDAVNRFFGVPHPGNWDFCARGGDHVSRRRRVDVIAVAHPHRHVFAGMKAIEQAGRLVDGELSASVFATPRADDFTG
jgi:hypothetical protein